jgi:hypothetical protein
MRGLSGVCRFLAAWRVLALATTLAMVMVGASPVAASAAHRPPRPGGHAGPGSGLTLAQAPAGLRSAVCRALGTSATPAAGTVQQAKLTASDGAANDLLGDSVAISGSTAVVGAEGTATNTGAAYVFTGSGGTWSQQAELTASDAAPSDSFGWSVALSGNTAVVGAPSDNRFKGAAFAFVNA